MATDFPLTLVRRNTITIKVTAKKLVDGSESVINLSGSTITYKVGKHADAPDLVSLSVSSGITIISAGDGRCNIALTTTHSDLAPGDYWHDFTVVVGSETLTCFTGVLTIKRRV